MHLKILQVILVSLLFFASPASTSEISKAGWSLKYADSEEVTGEDGNATNAFDDNESTIWHTEWCECSIPNLRDRVEWMQFEIV
jgi:hypothetical protein